MTAVLFVCLANICRSPAAEGLLKHMAASKLGEGKITVASCGIGDWQLGELPDARMRVVAQRRGVTLASRAQQFKLSFFDEYDYILAVDKEVLRELHRYASHPQHKAKLNLITAFSPIYREQDIPDPYYAGEYAFDQVLDMIEDSCEGLLDHIQRSGE